MKINSCLDINANAESGDFTWVITGKTGLCAYYTMPREEANRVIEALRVGTADWWQEQFRQVQPYLPKPPIETYDDPDPGDVNGHRSFPPPCDAKEWTCRECGNDSLWCPCVTR